MPSEAALAAFEQCKREQAAFGGDADGTYCQYVRDTWDADHPNGVVNDGGGGGLTGVTGGGMLGATTTNTNPNTNTNNTNGSGKSMTRVWILLLLLLIVGWSIPYFSNSAHEISCEKLVDHPDRDWSSYFGLRVYERAKKTPEIKTVAPGIYQGPFNNAACDKYFMDKASLDAKVQLLVGQMGALGSGTDWSIEIYNQTQQPDHACGGLSYEKCARINALYVLGQQGWCIPQSLT